MHEKDLLDIRDLSREDIDALIRTAENIIANPDAYAEKCRRKSLPPCFMSPPPARG